MTMMPPEVQPDYARERCGLCKGLGISVLESVMPCPACKATGKVLVHQPPLRCPRCGGDGKAKQVFDGLSRLPELCVICKGAGWVMTMTD